MSAEVDNLQSRVTLIETAINKLQVVVNNLASKKENNAVFLVLQREHAEFTQEINQLKATGTTAHDHLGGTLATGVILPNPILNGFTETPLSLTISSGTVTIDASQRSVFYIPIDQNLSTINVSNLVSHKIYLYLKQDPTGGFSITIPSAWKWPGAEPTWNTAANKWSLIILSSPDGIDSVAIGFTE